MSSAGIGMLRGNVLPIDMIVGRQWIVDEAAKRIYKGKVEALEEKALLSSFVYRKLGLANIVKKA